MGFPRPRISPPAFSRLPPLVRPGISVTAQTPNQTWIDGQAVNLALPSNTFTDALGLKMMFEAYENAGPNVTSWLRFNAATEDFYGTGPLGTSGTVQLAVVAFDGRFMQAADLFTVTFAAAPPTASPFQVPLPWANSTFNPRRSEEFVALRS